MRPTILQYKIAAPLTEFAPEFIQAMANRMAVSYHKYGSVTDAETVDCLGSCQMFLDLYEEDGNTERLVDAANYLMMEFMRHGAVAFRATDSDESPGRMRLDGVVDAERN